MMKVNHLSKRMLSLVLALIMLLSLVPMGAFAAGEGTTLYLVPNENWKTDNARFAAYYFDGAGNSGWTDAIDNGEGYYAAEIPAGFGTVIFCRMNPANTVNDWSNKWDQTGDLTIPTDGTNCYTLTEGDWAGAGDWSEYAPAVVLYLKPSADWLSGDARFAAYFFGNGDTWVGLTDADGDGYYSCEAPEGYPSVIFCRMNPGTTENNWDNKWNQTGDLTVPADDKVYYTVPNGTWDGADNTNWSVKPADGGETEKPTEPSTPTEPSEPADAASYYVAGDESLCGVPWIENAEANKMDALGGDKYQKVYANVAAGTYSLKVTDGTWANAWGKDGQNYTFVVSAVCDVTVSFDANTKTVSVTGDNVGMETTLEITSMHAVGNGSGSWLNGKAWDVTANAMEKTSENVYRITFQNVPAGDYQYKFAANGAWTHSWGAGATAGEAVYNSQTNIALKLEEDSNVTLTIDLTGYDHGTKNGAVYTCEATVVPAEPAVDYYLVGYINGADYSGEEYKFTDGKLTATFTGDTYVAVKASDNENWYMTAGWQGSVTSVTLYDSSTIEDDNKLQLPVNTEITLSVSANEDGTLTLSYATAGTETPDVPEIPEGTEKVTLHFLRPDTWGTAINGYLWVDSGAIPGYEAYNTWPGKAVTANAEKSGWYDLVVGIQKDSAFNFIFNDGGNQTADLKTPVITGETELWIVGNTVSTTAPGEWNGEYTYDIIVNFHNTASWENVNIKFGQGDSWDAVPGYEDYKNNEFGVAMEKNAANAGWYTVAFQTKANDAAINGLFNNGAWGDGNQTGNWTTGTLEPGTNEFWYENGAMNAFAPAGWVDPNLKVYVPGTFPGPSWDAASNQMTYDPELGLYVYTFENVPAANYEFKIAINGSWNENYGAGGEASGSNISVAVPETMDVTVYYNHATHNAVTSVNYVFAEITLNGAGIPENTKLTDAGLTGIYSVTVPLAAGTYTDHVISYDGTTFEFSEYTLEEAKDVTFFFDPLTGIFYNDASDIPINEAEIYYNSQDTVYKAPFGAVAAGEEVTFSIDTGADITSAVLVVGSNSYPMTEAAEGEGKRWTSAAKLDNPGEYDYYFVLSNGSGVAVYGDDDGNYGEGKVCALTDVLPYDLVVHVANFATPDWMKNAVIYQIFPDRFFDGDETNNTAQTWARGEVDYEYITDWYTLPENPEQEAMLDKDTYLSSGAHYGDGEWSNEIYGGDLKGITQRIDYLKALGVNVIYLNPVFWSISNHRYDAVDYTEIDPILGTLGDFEELVKVAEANGMHIILDGVFNHVSDDSVYFDRYYKFLTADDFDGKIGAYPYWAYVYDYMADTGAAQADAEAAAKVYFGEHYGVTDYSYTGWFEVRTTTMATADNIGLRAGKNVYSYEGWWGYDSMPVIKSTNGSEYQTGNWANEIINNARHDSVTEYWITKGNNGWRLDVANEVSDETWQNFRASVKALDSDAVIIGEIWDDATKYLMGDMYDSVMNYLFRNAVTSYAMGTSAEETTMALEKIRERYPEEAFYAMMNLVGSHDTTRILSYLDGIGDDRNQKDFDSAFPTYAKTSATAKARQYLVAFLQFTYPGAPTIYYGDEIGMVGSDDPDDRRAFEWGKGNQELVEWYAKLAAIRASYPALRTGDIAPMDLGNAALLAYSRSDEANTLIVIANNGASAATVENLPTPMAGEGYVDLVTGKSWDGTVPARSGVILVTEDQVKTVTVNTADLAPAYDASFTVAERCDHDYGEGVVTRPTCTESGYTTYTCSGCGDSYTTDEVSATGHSGGTATCVDPAKCEVCQESYGEENPENHTGGTELKGAVAATEEKEGYTGDTYCKGCGEKTEEGKVIEKLTHVHKMIKTPAKEATEYAEGNTEYYTCSKCGKIYKDAEGKEEITLKDTVIEKLPHTHKMRKTSAKKATKYAEGNIEYYTCTKCGKIYKDAEGKKEITLKDTVIPKITDNSATGDSSGIMLWSTLLVVSALGIALVALLIVKNKRRR